MCCCWVALPERGTVPRRLHKDFGMKHQARTQKMVLTEIKSSWTRGGPDEGLLHDCTREMSKERGSIFISNSRTFDDDAERLLDGLKASIVAR